MFDEPKLYTVLMYGLPGACLVEFWWHENAWVATTSLVVSGIFFAATLAALWDFWRVREVAHRYDRAKVAKEEALVQLLQECPSVYAADRIAGMSEDHVKALLMTNLPLYEGGDELAADMAHELGRRYAWMPSGTQVELTVEQLALKKLVDAMKNGGQMEAQNEVSGQKRRRLQEALNYLEDQGVIHRESANQPYIIDWDRAREWRKSCSF